MHVILEGIAPLEIKCVLKQLVLLGQLDLDVFNADIIGFPYSPQDIRDRSSPIAYTTLASNDNKMKQSSGKMLVLLQILPFLLDVIEGTAYFSSFLSFWRLFKFCFHLLLALRLLTS